MSGYKNIDWFTFKDKLKRLLSLLFKEKSFLTSILMKNCRLSFWINVTLGLTCYLLCEVTKSSYNCVQAKYLIMAYSSTPEYVIIYTISRSRSHLQLYILQHNNTVSNIHYWFWFEISFDFFQNGSSLCRKIIRKTDPSQRKISLS